MSNAHIESSFKQLASAAQALNSVSDDLSRVIRLLDANLKRLALGITAWVPVSNTTDDLQYERNELGYDSLDGTWALVLRVTKGYHMDPEPNVSTVPFNEAGRVLRTEAVDHIPALIEKMLQLTQEATEEMRSKVTDASRLAGVTSGNAPQPPAVPAHPAAPAHPPAAFAPPAPRPVPPAPPAPPAHPAPPPPPAPEAKGPEAKGPEAKVAEPVHAEPEGVFQPESKEGASAPEPQPVPQRTQSMGWFRESETVDNRK